MIPTGVEALIRWRCPARGVVAPIDFIPLLEETGSIVQVGRWVLEEACLQAAAWRAAGHPVGVAVNVSARQLDTDDFVADVKTALARSDLDAPALTLEITETALMRNAQETAARLREIKRLGVRIAIDDFGTGYSSLAHLQRFPVDALKIDRSFISQLTENPEGETLIRTLVQLGKALSIETLAEGIERHHELEASRAGAAARGGVRQRPGVSVRSALGGRGRGGVPDAVAAGTCGGGGRDRGGRSELGVRSCLITSVGCLGGGADVASDQGGLARRAWGRLQPVAWTDLSGRPVAFV